MKHYTLLDVSTLIQAESEAVLPELFGSEVPLLVVPPTRHMESEALVGDTPPAGTPDLTHQAETIAANRISPWSNMTDTSSLVLPIKKTDRNPFLGVITVGRGKNHDVRLVSDQVSKLHAILRTSSEGWLIQDSNSANGTYLDNLRLRPKEEHRLTNGCMLRFGDVNTTFLTQAGLASFCTILKKT